MYNIPDHLITQVKAAEEFIVAKVGHGVASLCGQKVTIEIPSADVRLGQRFYATATNRLVDKLKFKDVVGVNKSFTGRRRR